MLACSILSSNQVVLQLIALSVRSMQEKSYAGYLSPPARVKNLGKSWALGHLHLCNSSQKLGKKKMLAQSVKVKPKVQHARAYKWKPDSHQPQGWSKMERWSCWKCGLALWWEDCILSTHALLEEPVVFSIECSIHFLNVSTPNEVIFGPMKWKLSS